MKTVSLLPLDDRPCNLVYPSLLSSSDYSLNIPPKEILGKKKKPSDFKAIEEWLKTDAISSSALVISLDQYLYGGLLPSRLHHLSEAVLEERLVSLVNLKKEHPALKIYAFSLLMRCPYYSSSDEEPDYYETEGSSIYKSGYYTDLKKTRPLNEAEEKDYEGALANLNLDHLDDYLKRRRVNLALIKDELRLLKQGLFESFVVPNDDSAPFGYTRMDKESLFAFVKELSLDGEVLNYPGTDEVGMSLLAKAVNDIRGVTPSVYILASSKKALDSVPPFEDRPLKESLPKQLLANGLIETKDLEKASFVLAINGYEEGEDSKADKEKKSLAFAKQISLLIQKGKMVGVADTSIVNQSDPSFLLALEKEGILLKLLSYAGWNTSGNTLGTSLAASSLALPSKGDAKSKEFIIYQCYECYGYMGFARKKMVEEIAPKYKGMDYFHALSEEGLASKIATSLVKEKMDDDFPSLSKNVQTLRLTFPWSRFFECEIHLTFRGNGL